MWLFQVISALPKSLTIGSPSSVASVHQNPPTLQQQPNSALSIQQYSLDAIPPQQQPQNTTAGVDGSQQQPSAAVCMSSSSLSAAAASLYQTGLGCFLDNIGQQVLRSNTTTQIPKPIPNNERVDLLRFRIKEPQEWGADDVVAWILDVARWEMHIGFCAPKKNVKKLLERNGKF